MRARATFLLALLVLTGGAPDAGATAEPALAVVVHPSRQGTLTESDLARIYTRKMRFWQAGQTILPVNRDAISTQRARFTRIVFGAQAAHLHVYWNRQYFRGVLPPATLASDEAVLRYVASEPNAIGYVSAAAVDPSVRVILVLGK